MSIESLVFLAAGALLAVESTTPAEPAPTEQSAQVEESTPAEQAASVEEPTPAEISAPAEEPTAAEQSAPAEEPTAAEQSAPAEEPAEEIEATEVPAKTRTVEELGEDFGWEEAPQAPATVELDATEILRREVAATPRGWVFGARLERDVSVWGEGIDVIGGLQASWNDRTLGAAAEITITRPIGVRLEGRWYLWPRGWIRPWLGVGPVFYGFDVGMRAAGGAMWKVYEPFVVELDIAYEYYRKNSVEFNDSAVIVALGVGYNL